MIAVAQSGGITTLTLDRPERRNALDAAMIGERCAALVAAGADAGCRCVVLKGAGGSFCSGRDLGAASALRGLAPARPRLAVEWRHGLAV